MHLIWTLKTVTSKAYLKTLNDGFLSTRLPEQGQETRLGEFSPPKTLEIQLAVSLLHC